MPEKRICGAKTRQGTPCQQAPMANGRCRMHGGKSLGGIASPQYKTGRYSKYLPARLLERYEEAQGDNELLSLREDIALLDARLAEVVGRVDTGESGAIWDSLRDANQQLQEAIDANDGPSIIEALNRQSTLISRGVSDYAAWDEIAKLLDRRRRLVESERKRLVEMQQMITSERAMAMLAVVTDTIRKHVTDRAALAAIAADIRRLTTIDAG